MYFNVSDLFIVDTTSILKLMFPVAFCFWVDSCLGYCVAVVVVIFIYLFIVIVTLVLSIVVMIIINTISLQ